MVRLQRLLPNDHADLLGDVDQAVLVDEGLEMGGEFAAALVEVEVA